MGIDHITRFIPCEPVIAIVQDPAGRDPIFRQRTTRTVAGYHFTGGTITSAVLRDPANPCRENAVPIGWVLEFRQPPAAQVIDFCAFRARRVLQLVPALPAGAA